MTDEPKIVDFDAGEDWGAEVIQLDHPFRLKGVVYSAFTMRTPSGLDVTRFYVDAERSIPNFAIGLIGVDSVVFAKLHGDDAAKIVDKARNFLFKAP
jgi:hypothetical protein